ncbi:MAG: filamentous hemagglutinin N-terminal domain-containing protein, partial [Hormoscilla sp.]
GGNISDIDGLIRANGTANMFLINPNGIVFGPNARLDIGGSFFASTAQSILFENGLEYSARNPDAPPLLTINVPVGLQYGPNPGPIVNQSTAGLEVQPGNTLALIGGNVSLEGGNLTAPSGRIELGTVGSNRRVSINSTDNGLVLGYDGVNNFRDVELSGGSAVDVSGEPSGSVHVEARNFRLREDARITSINSGSQPGGGIQINAQQLVEIVGTGNYVEGLVGLVDNGITHNDNLPSGLFTTDEGTGSGGDIAIDTNRLIASDGIFIYAITEGEGRGGDFTINASESVELSAASLRANVSVEATGNGGNLTVNTGRLLMQEVAELGTVVEGSGQGGNLTINASESIDLVGKVIIAERSDGTPLATTTALVAGTELGSSGDAGELRVSTRRLRVRDGSVVTVNSTGKGRPGNLFLTATESAEFIGTSPDQFAVNSSIRAGALDPSAIETGGGNVTVTAGNLILRDEGSIRVSNVSVGSGGSVEIVANSILLDNEARIEAQTAFGQGGDIVLRTQDMRLRRNSAITATAGSFEQSPDNFPPEVAAVFTALATGVGDGGNIIIKTDTLVALDNSDITANAEEGFGGQVTITAQGIFGIEFREDLTPESDITVTSELGAEFNGVVEIRTPEVESKSALVDLPDNVTDPSQQIVKGCAGDLGNTFTITGRGGLPEDPVSGLRGRALWWDNRDLSSIGNQASLAARSSEVVTERIRSARSASRSVPLGQPQNGDRRVLVEATGWVIHPDGQVELVASLPKVANSRDANCR